jgi:hypothetical protein
MRDPLVAFFKAHSLALDRETYLAVAYPDGVPKPWTAEHEEELPAIFREPRRWQILPNQKGRGAN